MNKKQEQVYQTLCGLNGETVAQLFTDYHGTRLLSDGFREHLQNEGYIDEDSPVYERDCDNCCQSCEDCEHWRECNDYGVYD